MNADIENWVDIKKEEDEIIARNNRYCKGANCESVDGIGHSKECKQEHGEQFNAEPPEIFPGTMDAVSKLVDIKDKGNINLIVPSCFVRAEYQRRVFDNCMYFQVCKRREPICVDNPLRKKEI